MTDHESRSSNISYAPMCLVALSFCTFLAVNLGSGAGTMSETGNLKRLNNAADVQIALLKEHRGLVQTSIEQLKPRFIESEAYQKRITDLMRDLKALADSGDRDAKMMLYGVCDMRVNRE